MIDLKSCLSGEPFLGSSYCELSDDVSGDGSVPDFRSLVATMTVLGIKSYCSKVPVSILSVVTNMETKYLLL
jgi:hypothetical protein